jgi:hypothetical protein
MGDSIFKTRLIIEETIELIIVKIKKKRAAYITVNPIMALLIMAFQLARARILRLSILLQKNKRPHLPENRADRAVFDSLPLRKY